MKSRDFILNLYQQAATVFKLSDVAMLFPELNAKYLSDRLNYYVSTKRLKTLRRGIYAKVEYNPLEFANLLYTPSYVSLEYVLQQAGIVFQYDRTITNVSYLSRQVEVDNKRYSYRRIKPEIMLNANGIKQENNINIATPERAWLDILYLNKNFYCDNLHPLDKDMVKKIIPIYQSVALEVRALKLLENV